MIFHHVYTAQVDLTKELGRVKIWISKAISTNLCGNLVTNFNVLLT